MEGHDRPLTRQFLPGGEAPDIRQYEKGGGYRMLQMALAQLAPEEITDMVKTSNLRGRGGAGFPTGVKWGFIPMENDAPRPKYLVVNADEMEPGTFKDRCLLEGNPHQLIEGMIIAAYAIQADVAYIFLRWEYRESYRKLKRAVSEAYERGYLGENILNSGYRLEMHLHVSAGRYMCGEETALLTSLEGKRANPRSKPPYPPVAGLWGMPTLTNNVETLCNIPHIVEGGAEWFRSLSRTDNGGTKIFGVSGRVNAPGAWELPMGVAAGEVIERAGGMQAGCRVRGFLPGGASTDFLTEDHLDLKMDFDVVSKAGSRLGTGTMIILDDRTCPVGMVLNLIRFFAQESCGWCTPCRDGLPWTARTLLAFEEGRARPEDLEVLEQHTRMMAPGRTFCALAPGAMEPLQSALKYFREDFEAHIRQSRCPWRS